MPKVFIILLLLSSHLPAQEQSINLEQYREASAKKWAVDLENFDERNVSEEHPDNAILFCGSSSIRLWKTITEDIAPYHPIQRGFGGSMWSDVAVHAEELIHPHTFQAVVFFLANDIRGADSDNKHTDKSPEEVLALAQYVRAKVKEHQPDAEAFFIATTPCEARWKAWPEIRKANQLIQAWAESQPKTHFIATETSYIGDDGKPKAELFTNDRLHLNREGYKLWGGIITATLNAVLKKAE